MKKILTLILPLFLLLPITFTFSSNVYAEENIVQPRSVVRNVDRTYSYKGYSFILSGTYTCQTDGTVISSNLSVRAVDSGCTAYGLSQQPSGNSIVISFNFTTPAGSASVYDVVR